MLIYMKQVKIVEKNVITLGLARNLAYCTKMKEN